MGRLNKILPQQVTAQFRTVTGLNITIKNTDLTQLFNTM